MCLKSELPFKVILLVVYNQTIKNWIKKALTNIKKPPFFHWQARKNSEDSLETSNFKFSQCSPRSPFSHSFLGHPLADLHDGLHRWTFLHVDRCTAPGYVFLCSAEQFLLDCCRSRGFGLRSDHVSRSPRFDFPYQWFSTGVSQHTRVLWAIVRDASSCHF